ncbi:hypothetical protein BAE44_0001144 [Dichanthelium oligosanthes]|uniref:DUF1618 domain-containing protein n=1 Tax=Dichanthelium oligosanthes TaxID=888268 RepID=A0A1E5WK99_9POAL|nr:hypothetical protein BAE44_0001144 [Dichanthelium oligosanthes]
MATMKPDTAIADRPEVTYLSMLWQTPARSMGGVHGGENSSTDGGLVVLYTGPYRPGNGGFSAGRYMVYDAASSSVDRSPRSSTINGLGRPGAGSSTINGLGRTAAILRHGGGGEGAYLLAELVTTHDRVLPDAELYLWWSSPSAADPGGQWTPRTVCLPLPPQLCGPTYLFEVDVAFSFAGCRVCWVDLFAGVMVCDLLAPGGPEFSVVPLPEGCAVDLPIPYNRVGVPEQLRSMGCVRGAIKFVCKDGATLKTWALSPDLNEWNETAALRVEDLWASESFRVMELPRITPAFPVLSAHEDGVVYVAMNDIKDDVDEFEDDVDELGVELFPELKARYALRLDMLQNKVLSFTKSSKNSWEWLTPSLLASEFSAYLQGPEE